MPVGICKLGSLFVFLPGSLGPNREIPGLVIERSIIMWTLGFNAFPCVRKMKETRG